MNERHKLWIDWIDRNNIRTMAEVGVWRGQFAEQILKNCLSIERYYLIDAWRYLPGYFGRPKKASDDNLEQYRQETLDRLDPWIAQGKVVVLADTTVHAVKKIKPFSLDFAYIDSSHTLIGIATDLLAIWPKVKVGGFVGGDDYRPGIKWKHRHWEPVMVFPFVNYFALGMQLSLTALGHDQFLLKKPYSDGHYGFNGHTREYLGREFREAFCLRSILRNRIESLFPWWFVTKTFRLPRRIWKRLT